MTERFDKGPVNLQPKMTERFNKGPVNLQPILTERSGRGLIQVGSSTAGDASKPTSEKLKEGGQDLLGKFVEEQLKNIKITNVEEQLKTDPKITKVNKAIQRYISTW